MAAIAMLAMAQTETKARPPGDSCFPPEAGPYAFHDVGSPGGDSLPRREASTFRLELAGIRPVKKELC